MRILLLSRYGRLGASSRVRSMQYIPYFKKNGIAVDVEPLFSNEYLCALYNGRSRWKLVLSAYFNRLKILKDIRKYDLIWLEKEMFPFLPSIAEYLLKVFGVSYVVDYDDAIFHRYDQHDNFLIRTLLRRKIDKVMRHATLVIAGNTYLAERARSVGASRVEIVPTVVDTEHYSTSPKYSNQTPIVGWIGSPTTSRYLLALNPILASLKQKFDVRFVAVGANKEDLAGAPIEVWPWSEETEVKSIQEFDIGIMPLSNSPWECGKCGYKLIQYMACGIPAIASPIGVNKEIIKHGYNGYLAESLDEWKDAIAMLLSDKKKCDQMGKKGRLLVDEKYSTQVQSPRLLSFFNSVAN